MSPAQVLPGRATLETDPRLQRLQRLVDTAFGPQDGMPEAEGLLVEGAVKAPKVALELPWGLDLLLGDALLECCPRAPLGIQECKRINRAIQGLQRRRRAASKLIDEVEEEVMDISRSIAKHTEWRASIEETVAAAEGGAALSEESFLPFLCDGQTACVKEHCTASRSLTREGEGVSRGEVELRSVLRERLEETLFELSEARQELACAQRTARSTSGARPDAAQRCAALLFRRRGLGRLRVVMQAWRWRARRTATGARTFERARLASCFCHWRDALLHNSRRRAARRQGYRLASRCAAKLYADASAGLTRVLLIEWWRHTMHVAWAHQAEQAVSNAMAAAAGAPSVAHTKDVEGKRCQCTIM